MTFFEFVFPLSLILVKTTWGTPLNSWWKYSWLARYLV